MGTLLGTGLQAAGQRPLWVPDADRVLPVPDLFPQAGGTPPTWAENPCGGP